MGRDCFRFRHFSLSQEGCGMRISTDGVLLAAWAMPTVAPSRAIDLGAGTGLIAFFMAQQFPSLPIDTFEIDHLSANCLRRNLQNFPLPHKIKAIEGDFLAFYSNMYTAHSVDLIVCNPPYYSEGPATRHPSRQKARYNSTLPVAEVFKASSFLLSSSGRLALITPYDQKQALLLAALSHGLTPSCFCDVVTVEGKSPKRLLSEWKQLSPLRQENLPLVRQLVIRNREHHYTEAYKRLVAPYYLPEALG